MILDRFLLRFSSESTLVPMYSGHSDGLGLLLQVFPDLRARIRGRRILDFGCGEGHQAIALAREGAGFVLGLDTDCALISLASQRAAGLTNVQFSENLPPDALFDVIISQNSFEHFPNPEACLRQMKSALAPGGQMLITFAPPWYAPYGAHMHFFTRIPWVHLIFPETTVMRVRSHFRSDGAMRYEDVERGLNRMSLAKFEKLVRSSGCHVVRRYYEPIRGLPAVSRIPCIRELFVNRVNCILS